MTPYLTLLTSSCLAIAGQLLLKFGANVGGWAILYSRPFLGGLACYFLSMVLWIYSLTKVHLGVAYAFTSLTFVGVYIASFVILKEPVTTPKILALALIVTGFLILANGR